MHKTRSVTNYMARKPITFRPDQSIYDAIRILTRKKISGAPVLNEAGELAGIISEKDCLKVMIDSVYHNLPAGKVSDYMSHKVMTVSNRSSIVEVASLFLNNNYKRFPVLNEYGKLVGQISRSDVLRAVKDMEGSTWQEVQTRVTNDHTVIKENYKDLSKA